MQLYFFLQSLQNPDQKHAMQTALIEEVFLGVLQTKQNYIGKWRRAIEVEMNLKQIEA